MVVLLSILLGLLPETLYFTLFISYTKNLKEKRIKLFLLIAVAYGLCILIQKWQVLYYMLWIALVFVAMKLLYKQKTQIIDVFIISIAEAWMMILSIILMKFVNSDLSNYVFIYIIQRGLLFLPFIFKGKFNKLYKIYCKLWNRNDAEKRPIKSITLRNISLILLNTLIFFMNIVFINITNFLK